MSMPTLQDVLLEEYMVECSESNAASYPAVSPHLVLSPRLMVLFLSRLNEVWVVGVTSFGTLNTAEDEFLDKNLPLSQLTVIVAPSPILSPVTVRTLPLNEVRVFETV